MNIDIKSIDELKNLLINHKNQREMILELQAKNIVLLKEKRALVNENAKLKGEIADLKWSLMVSDKPRLKRMIINIGM